MKRVKSCISYKFISKKSEKKFFIFNLILILYNKIFIVIIFLLINKFEIFYFFKNLTNIIIFKKIFFFI
jgi:hypothetical protein